MERGCLLVHHPPSDHSHYGLTDQRQYLYKSVVLIMELTPRATVGLVLNRPTKSTLPDEFLNAPLMYGGDECGIHEEPRSQKVYAMHRLGGNAEDHDEVLSGLYVTSLGHAKSMIDLGLASDKNDVLAFCGFVTWETLDLVEEMDAGEWRTASIDSSTLYQTILASQQPDAHDMWATIMDGIHQGGRNETQTSSTLFDDRMLQEWSRTKLICPQPRQKSPKRTPALEAGMILRASSDAHLLDHQHFHKSLCLILQHDDDFTVGVLLNHPTVKTTKVGQLPVRYGGHFDMLDTEEAMPPFCLNVLGEALCDGEQVGPFFWKSSLDQAELAIQHQCCQAEDFIVVRGLEIWETAGDKSNPLSKDYQDGKWDIVEAGRLPKVWDALRSQQALSPLTMETNLDISHHAWRLAGGIDRDEDDEACAMSAALGRDALKAWVASILMNDPAMGP
jgi:putative AlgH/UPF0301 family transcriptional regulator